MVKKGTVAGIVLAAGEATRFGGCKLLAELQGRPVLTWVLDAALASSLDAVVLVLGSRYAEVRSSLGAELTRHRLQVVVNREFAAGQSTSLICGLKRISSAYSAAMFLLGDQPFIPPGLINLLLTAFRRSSRSIAAPTCRGVRGNPCLFDRSLYPDILRITGDQGGRAVVAAHPDQLLAVEVDDPDLFLDIDTPEDLAQLNTRLACRGGGRPICTPKDPA